MIVRRDLMHPEQRLGIVFPLRVLQRPLMLQKRRTLHEKHRERTQPRIHQLVMGILPSPSVGKCFKGRAQLLRNFAKGHTLEPKGTLMEVPIGYYSKFTGYGD